jgi:transaldolase
MRITVLTLSLDIAQFKPSEGTTNPSLLLSAAQQPGHAGVVLRTVEYIRSLDKTLVSAEKLNGGVEYLAVQFGTEIYKQTGGISTETDAALSFDTAAMVAAGLRIIDLYKQHGVPKEAVRVKISAT